MKNKVAIYFVFLLLIVSAFNFSGCSRLFGPSDEDVIKAVNESAAFKGGLSGLTLQPPIKILEKGSRKSDGAWPVKVKVTFTAYMSKDKISAPMERTLVYDMRKTKDSTGKTVWTASVAQ
ncbi:MAG TPA: hypothetical protein VL197_09150 [Nitrospirota bacterium]|nr:hypothetical protein [Nitrospirota bacterium]